MRLQLFKYKLPTELIAQNPPQKRSDARLMVVHKDTGEIEHRKFTDIIDYIDENDVLVANDSYMLNSLIYGEKQHSSVPIAVFLLREVDKNNNIWNIESNPARKVRIGNKIIFRDFDMVGEIIDNTSFSGRMMKLITDKSSDQINQEIVKKGQVKLPKYIKREPNEQDLFYTKSIFAKNKGSVNHIISSLHFDEKLLLKMQIKGIDIETITYHVNNFPMNKFDTKTISNNMKTPEFYNIHEDTIRTIERKKKEGSKIFAVGYSSLMGLENSFNNTLNSFSNVNSIAIKTSFSRKNFNICDGYLTNFHESGSLYLIIDAAFCGEKILDHAYKEAIKNKYNFLLFGDSLLIT